MVAHLMVNPVEPTASEYWLSLSKKVWRLDSYALNGLISVAFCSPAKSD